MSSSKWEVVALFERYDVRCIPISGFELAYTRMADGTVITMRMVSSSDGTPVVDINIKPSKHTGGVKGQKIHFVQEDE